MAGSTKSGSSAAYEYWKQHPAVAVSSVKEPHFFSHGLFGQNYLGLGRELTTVEQWRKGYGQPLAGKCIVDCDPLTLHGPQAPALVAALNPKAKIVLILRNPIDRAYSHYLMDVRECMETRTFLDAIKDDYRKYNSGSTEYCAIVRLGFYVEHLARFYERFDASQIRVWLYEDFVEKQDATYKEICDFVGVEHVPALEGFASRENVAAVPRSRLSAMLLKARFGPLRRPRELYLRLPAGFRRLIREKLLVRRIHVRPMARQARQLLGDIYKNEIFALQKMLGRDLTAWLREPDGPLQLPPELQNEQKSKQAEYFDQATDPEFEIERPAGTGRLYKWSIYKKFNIATGMMSCPLYGATLLDICCGSGMGAEIYAGKGALVTGLDISAQSVARATERARRHDFEGAFIPGDAEKLPYHDRSFEVVAVHDGLHHLPDPHAAIAEMARVADRAIIVIEPARSWLTQQAVQLNWALDYEEAGNFVYRLRESEIFKIAAAHGFKRFRFRQFLLYYKHEPFRWAKYIENTPLFFLFPLAFGIASLVAPRLGNKICVVCERE